MSARWLARGEPGLPVGEAWLSDTERARAATMTFTKRRTEFLVARWALKQTVAAALGWPQAPGDLARIETRAAPTGAPVLYVDGEPAGDDVSLTDRAGWAVCVIAPGGSSPGVDLELVEPRTEAFVRDYLTVREQRAVAAAVDLLGPAAVDLMTNLVWSAKESALKVLQTGLRRDTRTVEVAIDDITAAERTWSPLSVRSAEGEQFPGWWRRSGPFVLTTCARTAMSAPTSLDSDLALDSATPLHSWLTAPLSR